MDEKIREFLQTSFNKAAVNGFPPLSNPSRLSTPLNCTPYVTTYADFSETARSWPGRFSLVTAIAECKEWFHENNIELQAILIGGSFTQIADTIPSDVDSVWLYSGSPDNVRLAEVQDSFKKRGVDARLVPMDGDPILLLKIVSYFSVFYSVSVERHSLRRALLLIDCRNEQRHRVDIQD